MGNARRRLFRLVLGLALLASGGGGLVALTFIDNYSKNQRFPRSGYIKDVKAYKDIVYFGTANGLVTYDTKRSLWGVLHKDNTRLPSNYIAKIAVDEREGVLWLATAEGLARYAPAEPAADKQWRAWTKRDGLVDDETTAVAVDDEYVWVGTRFWGVARYDKRTQAWRPKPYTPIDGLGANRVYDLVVDGDTVWAATDDGLSSYDRYTDLWMNYDAKQGLSAKQVTCVDTDGKRIWAGTYGGGLNAFDKEAGKFKVYRSADGLADETVFSVRCDGDFVWAATFSGVSRYDKSAASAAWTTVTKASHKLADNTVTALAVHGNRLWIGTDGEGVTLLDKETPEAYLTADTGYVKPGLAEIRATVRDTSAIESFKVGYRASMYADRAPSVDGIDQAGQGELAGKNGAENLKVASWTIKDLKEGFAYEVVFEVVNARGKKTVAVWPFVVDNTPPVVTIGELPEAVTEREVFVRGNYEELYLKRIEVSLNKGKWERVENVDRKTRSFSHKLTLAPGENLVEVRLEDVGRHAVSAARKVIFTDGKPVIELPPQVANGVSRDAEFTVTGKVRGEFLQSVYLLPKREETTWKADGKDVYSFTHKVKLEKGANKLQVVAVNKAGVKATRDFTVSYNTAAPSVDFDKDLARETDSQFFTVKGKWDDADLREIVVDPGAVKASVDAKNKTWEARIKLEEGFNVVKATAIDEQDNKTVVDLQVIYKKGGDDAGRDQGKDAAENYRLYLEYKKKYDDLLEKYRQLLVSHEKLSGEGRGDDPQRKTETNATPRGGGKYFVPAGNAAFFAPYNRASGETMATLALKFLGSKDNQGLVARFNAGIPKDTVNRRGTLLLPTTELLRHLYGARDRDASWLLVETACAAFNMLGPGRGWPAYRQAIGSALAAQGLVPEANPADGVLVVRGKWLLAVAPGDVGAATQAVRLKMVEKKASFGYIVLFLETHLQFIRVE